MDGGIGGHVISYGSISDRFMANLKVSLPNLQLFNLLFDCSQISSHSGHITQLDHCVVQVVKHRLEETEKEDLKPKTLQRTRRSVPR